MNTIPAIIFLIFFGFLRSQYSKILLHIALDLIIYIFKILGEEKQQIKQNPLF
jgi:hypothetical protein